MNEGEYGKKRNKIFVMFLVRAFLLAYLPFSSPFGSFFEFAGPEMPRNTSLNGFKSHFRHVSETNSSLKQRSMHTGDLSEDWYLMLF